MIVAKELFSAKRDVERIAETQSWARPSCTLRASDRAFRAGQLNTRNLFQRWLRRILGSWEFTKKCEHRSAVTYSFDWQRA
jgi:hypothetical protein